ncbi:MAG TPA: SRPBCC family protein [Saprospiraceae bacterium]|nr:SRPBCC family protein [Saprospiraceae bacterium]
MSQYTFVTHWKFNTPIEKVWDEIRDMDSWPEWWKYVKKVELLKSGDANDISSIRRIFWSTALPYKLSFDLELLAIHQHKRIEGKAFGDLAGLGIWTFETQGDITLVRYDWIVSTTKKWMNLIAPIARPLFSWNHDKVMQAGFEGLMKRLNLSNPVLRKISSAIED